MPAMPPLDPPAGRGAPSPSGRPPNPRFSWGDFWALTKPYWVSEDRWRGGALLAVVVGLSLALVYLNVQFNLWYNVFYTALQKFDQPAFFHQLLRFCFLATLYIVAAVYRVYLNQALQIRWRKWLTEHYLDRWLAGRAYYRLQLAEPGTDNPDQRIAEDLRQFVQLTLSLSLGLLSSVVTLVSFCAILWTLSGALSFTLWGHAVVIPGYMLWAALLYAIVGTWLTDRIGRPLVGLNFEQQRFEANFRYSLVRLRENAEAVALYGGEARERDGFLTRFNHVVGNWWDLIRRQKRLTWFTTGYSQAAVIFPFVVAAPRYFSKGIELGGLMQTASAFGQVQDALSYLVTAYTDIAEWRAVIERLSGFRRAVALADGAPAAAIAIRPGDRPALGIEALDLRLPDGSLLLAAAGIELDPGRSVLITGASGSGKSTLFRALSGIWPFGSGRVRLPAGARMMFLPQKPYMPLGSLAEALSYPDDSTVTDEAAKQHALIDCGLAALVPRLDEQQNWGQVLSPGEQQRLAFARVLLKRPDWLFLDEATAALDEAMEQRLYRMLRQRLPGLNLVSIGHRSGLAALHDRVLVVQNDGRGGRLAEPDAVSAAGE